MPGRYEIGIFKSGASSSHGLVCEYCYLPQVFRRRAFLINDVRARWVWEDCQEER